MEGFVWGLELLSLACFLTNLTCSGLHLELALDKLSVNPINTMNPNKLHLRPLTKCSSLILVIDLRSGS